MKREQVDHVRQLAHRLNKSEHQNSIFRIQTIYVINYYQKAQALLAKHLREAVVFRLNRALGAQVLHPEVHGSYGGCADRCACCDVCTNRAKLLGRSYTLK